MIKKLTLSLLLVTLGLAQVAVAANPTAATEVKDETTWSHFFWRTNTRKALTIGSGIAALVGAYLLYQKLTVKPAGNVKGGAKNALGELPREIIDVDAPSSSKPDTLPDAEYARLVATYGPKRALEIKHLLVQGYVVNITLQNYHQKILRREADALPIN